ncbi:hypothetical protein QYE76_071721 [Lolium multiflorum]|uniref:Uncharacterized protein n=1 Tax=Lolium multiflorum TaxID=4521 RepID=A0AAD8SKL2_LOLMU|nr:hypothetical protein QYE76_071721 [Lolium multiflorum]
METGGLQRAVEVGVLPTARGGGELPDDARWRWDSGGARWRRHPRRRAVEAGSPAARGGGGIPGGARWRRDPRRRAVEAGSPAARGGGGAPSGREEAPPVREEVGAA